MSTGKVAKKPKDEALPLPGESTTNPDSFFPVVGIGASAGGLAAFAAFFAAMPAQREPGMAFVLVQHLAPDHQSLLTELIQRYTRMPAFEVEDGMLVRPNCAYIIPPNRDMAFLNGTLHLLEPTVPHGQRLPIDFFFRSLAQDQGERAIAIVLSGTGNDGTLGLRAIKGEGGMIMAQSCATAEFDGMPASAIATGLVDYTLPPAEMPARLMAYVAHVFGKLPRSAGSLVLKSENALKKIFILLRAQTGRDFSQYKPNTLHRRIERRMAVHQIELMDNYVKFLQRTPAEVDALFKDMLIGVTNFFRDAEAFAALEEQLIPRLFDDKPAGSTVRVWTPGCSSGEEAYSIAILLQERMEVLKQSYRLQVFATDIDSQAIATARTGRYPSSIAADLTPERLARFFSVESDGSAYRINKSIRDLVVFSEQDVIKDPPFSRLDLLSCRNLLIYMGTELQKKLFSLFHYALNPGGWLFLGTSESVGESSMLFKTVDLKAKLYQRSLESPGRQQDLSSRTPPDFRAMDGFAAKTAPPMLKAPPLRELTEQALLQLLAPVAALVNRQGDILYLHGRSGMYLEPTPGEVGISNILKMAREGLHADLSAGLRSAAASMERVRISGVRVKTNGHFTLVNLSISPVLQRAGASAAPPLFLVMLEEAADPGVLVQPGPDEQVAEKQEEPGDARILALTQELRVKEEFLQTANQELETSNQELKSANEELQSVNEELQSTNEELETSKEELQSVNEELATVNGELQVKVLDLSRANNDMNNLLAGTGIATVFLDQELRILRFTPAATRIINLVLSDVGRPVGHIVANLVGYTGLLEDAQAVLNNLIPKEVTVQTREGNWYTMRILPYRTLDNVIEGAVLTFVDISEMVRTREALREANELLRLAVVVRDAFDAITVQDLQGRMLAWNPGAVRMYGWSESEALLMNVRERIPKALREAALVRVHQLSQAEILEPYRTQRITKAGAVVDVWMTATALVNVDGDMYAIATTERTRESRLDRATPQLDDLHE